MGATGAKKIAGDITFETPYIYIYHRYIEAKKTLFLIRY